MENSMRDFFKGLQLSKVGVSNIKKSTIFTVIKKIACMIPFLVIALIMRMILADCFYDQGFGPEKAGLFGLLGLLGFVVILLLIRASFRANFVPAYREIQSLRIRLVEHIPSLSMKNIDKARLTDITGALSADCVTMELVICELIPSLTGNIVFVVLSVFILAVIDIKLALVMAVTIPAALLVEFGSLKLQKKLAEIQVESKQKLSQATQEYIDGMRVVKAYRLGGIQNEKLINALDEMKSASMKLELMAGIFVTGSEVILNFGVGLVVFASALFFTKDTISFFTILIYFMSVLCIFEPITEIIELTSGLTYMKVAVDRIRDILAEDKMAGEGEISPEKYDIEFENVSFSYTDHAVLKNLNLKIEEGKVTALVGPSGCGKTTLAKLAARLYDPDRGTVLMGGADISKADSFSVASHISTVFQEVVLFNDTIAANIRVGKPDASDEEVLQAAEAACCMEFVNRLEKGMETVISENGSSLSGGERQRISIARAILKDAPMVILDEATASLDPENEELVQQALSALAAKGKTVLVIAHRLRTVVNAHRIAVMEKGQIIGLGSHDDLMEKCGLYKNMYELQEI